jgi:hypothetical protein
MPMVGVGSSGLDCCRSYGRELLTKSRPSCTTGGDALKYIHTREIRVVPQIRDSSGDLAESIRRLSESRPSTLPQLISIRQSKA